MEDMLGKLKGLFLLREEEVICLKDDLILEGKKENQYGRIVKILSKRMVRL